MFCDLLRRFITVFLVVALLLQSQIVKVQNHYFDGPVHSFLFNTEAVTPYLQAALGFDIDSHETSRFMRWAAQQLGFQLQPALEGLPFMPMNDFPGGGKQEETIEQQIERHIKELIGDPFDLRYDSQLEKIVFGIAIPNFSTLDRYTPAQALVNIGSPAITPLIQVLSIKVPREAKYWAAWALVRIGLPTVSALESAIQKSTNQEEVHWVARALVEIANRMENEDIFLINDSAHVIPSLEAILNDIELNADGPMTTDVPMNVKVKKTIPGLIRKLQKSQSEHWIPAALGLRTLGIIAQPALLDLLNPNDRLFLHRVCIALNISPVFTRETLVDHLIEVLRQPKNPEVQYAAFRALRRFSFITPTKVLELTQDKKTDHQEEISSILALWACSDIGDFSLHWGTVNDPAIQALVQLLLFSQNQPIRRFSFLKPKNNNSWIQLIFHPKFLVEHTVIWPATDGWERMRQALTLLQKYMQITCEAVYLSRAYFWPVDIIIGLPRKMNMIEFSILIEIEYLAYNLLAPNRTFIWPMREINLSHQKKWVLSWTIDGNGCDMNYFMDVIVFLQQVLHLPKNELKSTVSDHLQAVRGLWREQLSGGVDVGWNEKSFHLLGLEWNEKQIPLRAVLHDYVRKQLALAS